MPAIRYAIFSSRLTEQGRIFFPALIAAARSASSSGWLIWLFALSDDLVVSLSRVRPCLHGVGDPGLVG